MKKSMGIEEDVSVDLGTKLNGEVEQPKERGH